ncbi:MAG: metallophosphoesterase [Candidatus Parcubacteria bacterium]|nr:metallophosphoesterase [Candidatus Parcubacteria bacterium]
MAKYHEIDWRIFLFIASLVLAGAILPIRSVSDSAYPWVGQIAAKSDGNLRILAFTDLHFGQIGRKIDEWTVRDMKKMNELHQPDLVIVTGDAWFENPKGKGIEFCRYFCKVMSDLGRPWAYVRGNHDKADDFAVCEELLASTPGSLYRGFKTNGNYRLKVTNGELTTWNLIFINDAAPKIGFGPSQIAWLKNETDRIRQESSVVPPSLLFCHVPILAYSQMVRNNMAMGIRHEGVNFGRCDPETMEAIVETGQIKGMFCGHDHLNDFEGDWLGVHFEYLRATGYAGYGESRLIKGGKVIDLCPDGTFTTKTVFANGQEWSPISSAK